MAKIFSNWLEIYPFENRKETNAETSLKSHSSIGPTNAEGKTRRDQGRRVTCVSFRVFDGFKFVTNILTSLGFNNPNKLF